MIPGVALFSHLPCGFGRRCDRPYCTYFHEDHSSDNEQKEVVPIEQPKHQAQSPQYNNNEDSNSMSSMQIFQEEEPTSSEYYNQYAYQGYIEQATYAQEAYEPYSTSMKEANMLMESQDMGQYTPYRPVDADYAPKPIIKKSENRKHHNYSALDDKPKAPVDLSNDSILLGASHNADLSAAPTKPAKQVNSSRREPIASITTIRIRPDKNRKIATTPPQTKRHKGRNQSIDSKMTAATNKFIAELKENKSNGHSGKVSSSHQPPKVVDDRHEFTIRSPRLTPDASPMMAKYESTKQYEEHSTSKNGSTTTRVRFSDEIQVLRTPPMLKIDTEQELREIEILERKTKLLKEYKQLAQEIAEIEAKRGSISRPDFVDSLFEDDPIEASTSAEPPPKIARVTPKLFTSVPEPMKQRISARPSDPRISTRPSDPRISAKPSEPQRRISVTTSNSEALKKSTQISRTSIQATSTTSTLTNSMASNRSSLHKQMMNRVPQTNGIVAPASKWSLSIESKAKTKTDGTKVGTVNKVDSKGRVAHVSQAPQLMLVDRFSTKIPFNQRHRSLQKLHEEFCKHQEIDEMAAVEMAQKEEKMLFDRSETSVGYASSLAGVVRAIRSKQFSIPTVDSQGQLTKQPSITETMEKERKHVGRSFTEAQFYQHLHDKYLMTSDQLRDNGYPYVYKDEDGKRRVKIDVADEKKMFSEDNDFRRTCCRCGTEYQLRPDGSPVYQQDCIFHWKRAFKKRVNRTMESRYGCCDADLTVKGCVVHPQHVHQTMRRQVLNGFARTPPPTGPEDTRTRKIYAMDCEMVYTTWGISLARLTVVDWNDDLVLDVLVKPKEKVIDYNTKFSGLTEDMIERADCDLDKARRRLFELVNSETILIGHSLESDLRALRLVHRRVVDTSVVFPHRLGPPMKRALRNLASDYLQKIIQEDVEGHCSKEDASTCMQLMVLKTKKDT